MRLNRISMLAHVLLLLCLTTLLTACGGGSTGTGSASGSDLKGKLLSESNEPLAQVAVLVLETGAMDVTDENGDFSMPLDLAQGETLTLIVNPDNNASEISLGTSPESPSDVSVVLALDRNSQDLQVVEIQVRPRATATPTVAPTATRPVATPTARVTPVRTPSMGVSSAQVAAEAPTPFDLSGVPQVIPGTPSVWAIKPVSVQKPRPVGVLRH